MEEGVEEISEEDLEGVAGGYQFPLGDTEDAATRLICDCGDEDCDCLSCDSEATAG